MKLRTDFATREGKTRLYNVLKTLKPAEYTVEIKRVRAGRSDPQRRYYFGVICAVLSQELGYTKDEIHEVIKVKFCPKDAVLPTGEVITIPGSTKDWDIADSQEKHEEIRRWALTDLEIYIPEPNEFIEI